MTRLPPLKTCPECYCVSPTATRNCMHCEHVFYVGRGPVTRQSAIRLIMRAAAPKINEYPHDNRELIEAWTICFKLANNRNPTPDDFTLNNIRSTTS